MFALGSAERLAGRYSESRRTLSKVIELARRDHMLDLLVRTARALRPTHAVGGVPDPLVRAALEDVLRLAPTGADPRRIGALAQLACVPPYALDMRQCGELSAESLALARQLGDPNWLVEALSARLHALSGPDHTDDVVGAADELLARGQGPWVRCEAHMARIGAFLHRCDVASADAALREVERAAREARLPEAIWFHDRIRNQRRILDGDFDTAKTACDELARRAQRIGLVYGAIFVGTQQQSIRLAKRGPEVARELEPAACCSRWTACRRATARAWSRSPPSSARPARPPACSTRWPRGDFDDVPKDIGYLNALGYLARAAAALRDRTRAEQLYARLAPYTEFNSPNSMLFYDGPVAHPLALLAALLGWDERAEAHFETALAANERLGARPRPGARDLRLRPLARRPPRGGLRPRPGAALAEAGPGAGHGLARRARGRGRLGQTSAVLARMRECSSPPRAPPPLWPCSAWPAARATEHGFAPPPPVVEVITVVPETVRDTIIAGRPARVRVLGRAAARDRRHRRVDRLRRGPER